VKEQILHLTTGLPDALKQRHRERDFASTEELLAFAQSYKINNDEERFKRLGSMLEKLLINKVTQKEEEREVAAVSPAGRRGSNQTRGRGRNYRNGHNRGNFRGNCSNQNIRGNRGNRQFKGGNRPFVHNNSGRG